MQFINEHEHLEGLRCREMRLRLEFSKLNPASMVIQV